jgi:hypothetical protein
MTDRLDTAVLVTGYLKAANRFMTGGDRPLWLNWRTQLHREDPERFSDPSDDSISSGGLYHALFEALNWANTIDLRLGTEWPGEQPMSWYADIENGASVRGLRYARACVHHDWSLAVTLPEERRDLPLRQSVSFWEWVPTLPARKPDPDGLAAYEE